MRTDEKVTKENILPIKIIPWKSFLTEEEFIST